MMRALAVLLSVWMLWLPQAALAWSLNVPPGTPAVNTPIGMWYLHPDIHFSNIPGGGSGSALSFTVPGNTAGALLRSQLTKFGFVSVGGAPLTNEGSIVMDDGVNYVIQSTPHLKQRGLGFVLQFRTRIISTSRHSIATQTNSWTPVTSIISDECPNDWVSLAYTTSTQSFTVRVDMDIRIHWIRLADLDTSGASINVTSGLNNTRIFNVRLRTGNGGGCDNITVPGAIGNNTIYQFLQSVHVYRAPVQSCTTPPASQNMTVPLGMYHASEFTGSGHTTGPIPFTFTVTCPEGYNSIRYWVGSPYRDASDPDGVVRLDPQSIASGFAVKIWDGPGTTALPIKFGAGNTYAVPGYVEYKGLWLDPSKPTGDDRDQANANYIWERGEGSGGGAPNYGQPRQDYPITLKAALYQTEPTVTPGPFKTHILIHLVHK